MAKKITDAIGDVNGKKIAVLGLAFKPNTDDMRDAPSLTIIPQLQKKGAEISAYDPESMEEAKHQLDDVVYTDGAYECVKDADAVVIVTEWDQFRALDLDRLKTLMKAPTIIDLRNIYNPDDVRSLGFKYVSVGRA
jgi:UDPglucose 6-dehydrogenase